MATRKERQQAAYAKAKASTTRRLSKPVRGTRSWDKAQIEAAGQREARRRQGEGSP